METDYILLVYQEEKENNLLLDWIKRYLIAIGAEKGEVSFWKTGDDLGKHLKDYKKYSLFLIIGGSLEEYDTVKNALSKELDLLLMEDRLALEYVRASYRRLYYEDPSFRDKKIDIERIATIPLGFEPLDNAIGLLPGLVLEEDDSVIAYLPGEEKEIRLMFADKLVHYLRDITKMSFSVKLAVASTYAELERVNNKLTEISKAYKWAFVEGGIRLNSKSKTLPVTISIFADKPDLLYERMEKIAGEIGIKLEESDEI